jgi:uncharacterized phiE125 gp8 family phage protein
VNRELVTAPASTPISLTEAKAHLVVDHADDDTLITSYIEQAVDFCEKYTGRKLITQTWCYYFDCFDAEIVINETPIQSITSVKYQDSSDVEQTVTGTDYYTSILGNRIRIEAVNSWPSTFDKYDAVKVEIVQGYADADSVPDAIKTAIYLIVGHLYRNRESVTAINMSELPLGVKDFLNRYRVVYL